MNWIKFWLNTKHAQVTPMHLHILHW